MTDEPEKIESAAPEEDWFLQALVSLVNSNEGATIGVTLSIGGGLVSGKLTSGKAYFAAFGEALETYGGVGGAGAAFAGMGERMYVETDEDEGPPAYIHLKDAHFFVGQHENIPAGSGVWWRARIAAVDGFVLGALETAPQK